MSTKPIHITVNQPQSKTNLQNEQRSHGNVWQDKDAVQRVRASLFQPVTVSDTPFTRRSNSSLPRSQKQVPRRQTVQVAAWVSRPIRDQLLHIARTEGLSMSQTIGGLLEEILRQKLQKQQAAVLPKLIDQAVIKAHRSFATRLSALLVCIAFDTGQTRVLTTNILGRQPGVTEHVLKDIIQAADKRTKTNLTRRTPQITELITAVEKWLREEDQEWRVGN